MKKIVTYLLLAISILAGMTSCASSSQTGHSPKSGQRSGGCH